MTLNVQPGFSDWKSRMESCVSLYSRINKQTRSCASVGRWRYRLAFQYFRFIYSESGQHQITDIIVLLWTTQGDNAYKT